MFSKPRYGCKLILSIRLKICSDIETEKVNSETDRKHDITMRSANIREKVEGTTLSQTNCPANWMIYLVQNPLTHTEGHPAMTLHIAYLLCRSDANDLKSFQQQSSHCYQ